MTPPKTPKFIQVIPAEVEQYGPAASIVLAHIRYRCSTAGDGRIESGGHRWWRASRSAIASDVGMSVKVVRKALTDLGEAVLAERFEPKSDQTLAYRVAASLTSQKPHGALADQSEAPQGNSVAPRGVAPCPVGLDTVPHGATAPIYAELKEGVRTHTDHVPSRFCDEHPIGTPEDCPRCGNARTHFVAWQAAEAERDVAMAASNDFNRRRHRMLIEECPDCYGSGRVSTDQDGTINRDGEWSKPCEHRSVLHLGAARNG